MSILDKIYAVLIAIDQAAATALFNGQHDITISARCGMALLDKTRGVYNPDGPHGIEAWALNALAAALDDVQKDHCIQAILGDRDRAVDLLAALAPYVAVVDPAFLKV